jgi:hypothetical protein
MRRKISVSLLGALLAAAIANAPSRAGAQQPMLTDQESDIVDAYRVMEGVTLGLFGATALGGLSLLYNYPTAFGDGACARGEGFLGNYGCDGRSSLLHGTLAIATIASYTATEALALAAPDLDQGDEDTVTDVLGVVHGVGIGVTGLLGLLAAHPELIGLHGGDANEFSRVLRTVHYFVALVTAGAFATHAIVDYVE